ncbi:hypothetical protein ACIQPQ_00745 [Streptomyces sp. NPDC091281]|uniref:hypothetical protein n=1 Tax=Streptomyces sp. NPDC091281 TaxID=3365985 RepID=UPI003829749C
MAGGGVAAGGVGALRRRLAAGAAVLVTAVLLALAAPADAQAAPASCTGRKVRTLAFANGQVQVYRGGGSVCAVTVQKHPGTKRLLSVGVQARGHHPVRKARRHARTTLPVTVYAGHRCVRVSGSVGTVTYTSGWILC